MPPKARSYPSAVYDVTANRLIVHGGCDGHCGNILSDTWVLTNANGLGGTPEWVRLPVDAPLAGHAAAYDPVSNRMIVFGGRPAAYTDTNTVRILKDANGIGTPTRVTLAPVGVAPPPRGEVAAAAYDSLSNRLIVFGGRLTQALNAGSLNDCMGSSERQRAQWDTGMDPSGTCGGTARTTRRSLDELRLQQRAVDRDRRKQWQSGLYVPSQRVGAGARKRNWWHAGMEAVGC